MTPLVRLLAVLSVAFGLAWWPVFAAVEWSLPTVVAVAVALMLFISLGSYFAFGLDEVRTVLLAKIRQRMPRRPV
jgi:hypothetical protein